MMFTDGFSVIRKKCQLRCDIHWKDVISGSELFRLCVLRKYLAGGEEKPTLKRAYKALFSCNPFAALFAIVQKWLGQ